MNYIKLVITLFVRSSSNSTALLFISWHALYVSFWNGWNVNILKKPILNKINIWSDLNKFIFIIYI